MSEREGSLPGPASSLWGTHRGPAFVIQAPLVSWGTGEWRGPVCRITLRVLHRNIPEGLIMFLGEAEPAIRPGVTFRFVIPGFSQE